MGNYQKFRGNPENKLFFLLNNFMGGINTEFSDDNSSDGDFESIINFDMDKLGTLNKRGGFGKLTAISEIFNKLNIDTDLPNIKNRTEDQPNPEDVNDNVVYMKLIRDDNHCFRALSGFDGENAYRKYQEMYGFQNNRFILLIITTKFADTPGTNNVSTAWLYNCYLPELEYQDGEPTDTETMTINCYRVTLPAIFNWDRNLMNIETIEYYDKIYFTGNDRCIMSFDRAVDVIDDETFSSAFNYSGLNLNLKTYTCAGTEVGDYYFVYNTTNYQFTMPSVNYGDMLIFDGTKLTLNGVEIITTTDNSGILLTMRNVVNSAYIPSGLEVRHIGFNLLCDDPLHAIDTQGLTTDSIQGIYVCTLDNIPLQNLPLGQKFLLNIIYTGTDNGFEIEIKEGESVLSFDLLANTTLSQTGLKVYEVTFKDVPSGEVEIKITKTGATLEPYYDYYNVAKLDSEAKAVSQLNIGDYGLCEMYNRAIFYKKDTIWFSEVNNFKYIPNYNYVTLPIEPTDEITKICYFKKSYIIFTKQKIYKMIGSFGTTEFEVQPVNTSLGCHAGNTVVPIEDTLYFVSPRGLYALKSSQFVEGYENVKELDLKVKKLTSDFTKYSDELSSPAIRFNGVSERAYALRYKDKYLLFYNNYNDKGDYAAVNGLDTLAYQFDIGAFTTYRFKEKPTFLFMIDNAIETFATTKQKEVYSDEEVLLNYDFTTSSNGKIIDSSDNNLDGNLRGNYKINECTSINIPTISGNEDIASMDCGSVFENINKGMGVFIDAKLYSNKGGDLFNTHTSEYSYTPISGEIIQDYDTLSNQYIDSKTKFSYDIIYNEDTQRMIVNYKIYFMYNPKNINTQIINYNLYLGYTFKIDNTTMINPSGTFNITSGEDKIVSILVSSGSFSIDRNIEELYNATWSLQTLLGLKQATQSYYNYKTKTTNELINLPAMSKSKHIIRLRQTTDNNLYLEISSSFGTFYLSATGISDITTRHKWGFVIANYDSNNGYPVYILKDDTIIKTGYITNKYILETINRDECFICGGTGMNNHNMDFYSFNIIDLQNNNLVEFNCNDLIGTEIASKVGGYKMTIDTDYATPTIRQGTTFKGGYLEIPKINETHYFSNGFKIEFEGTLGGNETKTRILDLATSYNNDNSQDKKCSINLGVQNNTIEFNTTSINYKISENTIDLNQNHTFKIDCVDNGSGYTLSLYIDSVLKQLTTFNYGGITNIDRISNFIAKSNTTIEPNFIGTLKAFKITIYKGSSLIPIYENNMYEFDTTSTDFGKPIYIELKTKGVNMKYPQHLKKLKHIFVKMIGGYNYGEFFFILYGDGYKVNDPKVYEYYVDDNGTIVQDYSENKDLEVDERVSLLGNMRLDRTKLGEGIYQTRKMVIPKKAKNFTILISGDTEDYLSLESFGFVVKLGKVKEG